MNHIEKSFKKGESHVSTFICILTHLESPSNDGDIGEPVENDRQGVHTDIEATEEDADDEDRKTYRTGRLRT